MPAAGAAMPMPLAVVDASTQTGAAAAVAALFFLAAAASPPNFALTRFHLYIPLGLASLFRGAAYAARAAWFAGGSADCLAVYGALTAAGFGISVAMGVCFSIIWLRNAAHQQPPRVARALASAGKLLVALVIAFGPVLGVVAAGLTYGGKGNPVYVREGLEAREASAAGFLAACACSSLMVGFMAVTWTLRRRRGSSSSSGGGPHADAGCALGDAAAGPDHLPASPRHEGVPAGLAAAEAQAAPLPRRGCLRGGDGLVWLLLGVQLLLTWAAAMRLASVVSSPQLSAAPSLWYAAAVLPELLVAALWAVPRLAPRVALGGRYPEWQALQRVGQPRHRAADAASPCVSGQHRVGSASSCSLSGDAEAAVGEPVEVGKGV